MNDGDSPALGCDGGTGGAGPLAARPYMVVGEIPAAMAVPGGRGAGYWPVVHLIKDWNNQPESRAQMLAGGLPEGADACCGTRCGAPAAAGRASS